MVSYRGAFGNAFLLVLPEMDASSIDEALAEKTSRVVGRLHRRHACPVATQNGQVIPEWADARGILLRLPEIIRIVFTEMIVAAPAIHCERSPRIFADA